MLDVGRLYEQYRGAIAAYARRRVPPDDVDDVIAETFARAVKGAHQYRDMGHRPSAWLYEIARTVVYDMRGRPSVKRRQSVQLLPGLLNRRATIDAGASHHVEAITVRQAIDTLTPQQQRVVTLRYLDGASVAETTDETGIGGEAVKKLAWRGRMRLHHMLGESA